MVVKIDPTCCHGSSEEEREERERDFLREVERFVAIWAFGAVVLSRGLVSQQEEKRKRNGEVSEELGVGGGHAVAFAVHLYATKLLISHPILSCGLQFREFFLLERRGYVLVGPLL